MKLSFSERRIAFGLCGGMSNRQIAEALGMDPDSTGPLVTRLLTKTGMANRFEFALQQNAAVRDLLHAEPFAEQIFPQRYRNGKLRRAA
jgi:DNA-binding CsgD family transcriptional regulator